MLLLFHALYTLFFLKIDSKNVQGAVIHMVVGVMWNSEVLCTINLWLLHWTCWRWCSLASFLYTLRPPAGQTAVGGARTTLLRASMTPWRRYGSRIGAREEICACKLEKILPAVSCQLYRLRKKVVLTVEMPRATKLIRSLFRKLRATRSRGRARRQFRDTPNQRQEAEASARIVTPA